MKYIKSKSAINPSKTVQLNVTMMCDSPSSTSNKPKLFQLLSNVSKREKVLHWRGKYK